MAFVRKAPVLNQERICASFDRSLSEFPRLTRQIGELASNARVASSTPLATGSGKARAGRKDKVVLPGAKSWRTMIDRSQTRPICRSRHNESNSTAFFFAVVSLAGLGFTTANYWALTQALSHRIDRTNPNSSASAASLPGIPEAEGRVRCFEARVR